MIREDWEECSISEVSEIFNGDRGKNYPSRVHYVHSGIPFVSAGNIGNNNQLKNELNFITVEKFELLRAGKLKRDDIVYCIRGSVGKFALIDFDKGAIASSLCIIRTNESIDRVYFCHYLDSPLCSLEINKFDNGTAQPNLSAKDFKKFQLPLPSKTEQRAIVKKLEELFSSLDSGMADLKKAQAQLKIYRQAVLKKAFEGELTKEWREEQTDLPSANDLLEQIKEERQKHYEKQLEDWRNAVKVWEDNGKEGKKPRKPQKLKEYKLISTEDLEQLPRIPNNWKWQKFGNVCLKIMDGTHFSPKNVQEGSYKYITAKNIKEGRIDLSKISFVTKKDHEEIYSRCDVKKGDVLYIKDGATTGKAAINSLSEEFSLLSSVGVFRTIHHLIIPKFLEYYLNAQITRNRMLSKIAGVAITRLTLVKLNNSIFIVCSPLEQTQIVKEIETRLSVCDKVEESITISLKKAEALRQSILKKAFEGKLLTAAEIAACKQEADYEPASVLLEKIKAEKVLKQVKTKKQKKK